MMCVADQFVVICLDSITDSEEKKYVTKQYWQVANEIIDISICQMNQFAGNMLQLENKHQRENNGYVQRGLEFT